MNPPVLGASHVAFTVTDLQRSVDWYRRVLGGEEVLDEPGDERAAVVLHLPGSDLMVGLVWFRDGDGAAFHPHRTGLDHFAFSVEHREELDQWAAHLDELGVAHSGPIEVPPGAILNFADPDGIALAIMWRRPPA